jgi:hypothetical protein
MLYFGIKAQEKMEDYEPKFLNELIWVELL